jgi:poly(3-hydroxybutyrate) depolymerase
MVMAIILLLTDTVAAVPTISSTFVRILEDQTSNIALTNDEVTLFCVVDGLTPSSATVNYAWTVRRGLVPDTTVHSTSSFLGMSMTKAGDLWACTATPFSYDGSAGSPVTSAGTGIISNSKTRLYVDQSAGSDTNSGDYDAPFASIKKAAQVVGSNSAIYVKDGTYTNNNFGSGGKNNGAAVSLSDLDGVDLQAYPGHSPKIAFDGSGGIIGTRVTNFQVSGFEIEGGNAGITKEEAAEDRLLHSKKYSGRGIVVWEGSRIYIHHNLVHHAPNSGIRINKGDYCRIENNVVHSNTWWSSSAESAIVYADSRHIDEQDIIKMTINYNEVYDNINKIPYYNANYDDPQYLIDNQMHVAREYYGSKNQTFIIDGSGVYVSRNAASYLYGWMELAHNTCYRNGINGVVVHKTDRAYVHHNVLYDNGQVPKTAPELRQGYAGLTLNTATQVHFYSNNVTTTLAEDAAFASTGSEFVSNPSYVNFACRGTVSSAYGDLVKSDHPDMCWTGDVATESPTATPITSSPTPEPRTCEDANTGINFEEGKDWNSYTYTCRANKSGECLSDEKFCAGTWHASGFCGSGALGLSCGCCEPSSDTTCTAGSEVFAHSSGKVQELCSTNLCAEWRGERGAEKCIVLMDVPENCAGDAGKACPVAFFFHGAGGNNEGWRTQLANDLHDGTNNFIGIYPAGVDNQWNTGSQSGSVATVDDIAFVMAVLDTLRTNYLWDGRYYAYGHSNGAALVNKLVVNGIGLSGATASATQLIKEPAASATPAGSAYLQNALPYAAAKVVPYLNFHGDADTTVPFDGGELFSTGYILDPWMDSLAEVATLNGCSNPSLPMLTSTLSAVSDSGAATTAKKYWWLCGVIGYKVVGGGHGVAESLGGKDRTTIAFDFWREQQMKTQSPTPAPTTAPTMGPTMGPTPLPEQCEDANAGVTLGDGKTWGSYTYSCRTQKGGECLSDARFCDTANGATWHASGFCGSAALGITCGCCEPPAPVFDCARYKRECVDTGVSTAYADCDGTVAANPVGMMDCRIEHLGRITPDGDSTTQNQHCAHAAPVATGACSGDNPLVEPATDSPTMAPTPATVSPTKGPTDGCTTPDDDSAVSDAISPCVACSSAWRAFTTCAQIAGAGGCYTNVLTLDGSSGWLPGSTICRCSCQDCFGASDAIGPECGGTAGGPTDSPTPAEVLTESPTPASDETDRPTVTPPTKSPTPAEVTTESPTPAASSETTDRPTFAPTDRPTVETTDRPTFAPTNRPTVSATGSPTWSESDTTVEVVVEATVVIENLPSNFELPKKDDLRKFKAGLKTGIAKANGNIKEEFVKITNIEVVKEENGRRRLESGGRELQIDFVIAREVPAEHAAEAEARYVEEVTESITGGSLIEEIQKADKENDFIADDASVDMGAVHVGVTRQEEEEEGGGIWKMKEGLGLKKLAMICGGMFGVGIIGIVLSCMLKSSNDKEDRKKLVHGDSGGRGERSASHEVGFGNIYGKNDDFL